MDKCGKIRESFDGEQKADGSRAHTILHFIYGVSTVSPFVEFAREYLALKAGIRYAVAFLIYNLFSLFRFVVFLFVSTSRC